MKTTPAPDDDCAAAVTFARIAAMSPPDLPPGFAERIVRDVPRLAQMPAPVRLPIRGGSLPLVRLVASQQARRPSAGRRPIAGWSALAAGIAAVALMLPSAFPARPVTAARSAVSVPPQQVVVDRNAAPQMTPVLRLAARSPASHAIRAHLGSPTPVTPDSEEAAVMPAPVGQPAPLPGVIAVAVAVPVGIQPSRPVYGPVDTEAASSSSSRTGTIGSGQSPGYAFTGGAHP